MPAKIIIAGQIADQSINDRRPLCTIAHCSSADINLGIIFAVRRFSIGTITAMIIGVKIENNELAVLAFQFGEDFPQLIIKGITSS